MEGSGRLGEKLGRGSEPLRVSIGVFLSASWFHPYKLCTLDCRVLCILDFMKPLAACASLGTELTDGSFFFTSVKRTIQQTTERR